MDKRQLKGQAGMEFMLLTGIVLLMFTVMLGVVADKTSEINRNKNIIAAEDYVTTVQKEINLAARVLDGYSREFYIPQRINKQEYNISIIGDEVVINTARQDFWRTVPPVVGNITKGFNTINKTNGVIYLN